MNEYKYLSEVREWETLKARGWDGKLKIEGLRSIRLFATQDFFFFFVLLRERFVRGNKS